MKSKSITTAFALVLALGFSTQAFAAERLLGKTELSGIHDRDIIQVDGVCPGPANPMITSLRITVRRHPANIEQLEVRYGNGMWDYLPVREQFGAGSSSRWIDLRGGARCVEAVRVVGNSEARNPRRQALVEVYGR